MLDPTFHPIAGDKAVFGDLEAAVQTDKNYQVCYEQLKQRVEAGEAVMPEVYLACGTDDEFISSTRALRDQLVADSVALTYDEQPGGHEWDFWDAQIKKIIDWLPLDEASQGFGSGAID
jgi:S-formylglutathione hydrolase FrmB